MLVTNDRKKGLGLCVSSLERTRSNCSVIMMKFLSSIKARERFCRAPIEVFSIEPTEVDNE
jgi:hypothetical protein